MAERTSITDQFWTRIKVTWERAGSFVDLEGEWRDGTVAGVRLTPEQARELGEWLVAASEERG